MSPAWSGEKSAAGRRGRDGESSNGPSPTPHTPTPQGWVSSSTGLRTRVGTQGWGSGQPHLARHPQDLGHPGRGLLLRCTRCRAGSGPERSRLGWEEGGGCGICCPLAAPSFLEQLTSPLAWGCRELQIWGPCSTAQPGSQGPLAPAALSSQTPSMLRPHSSTDQLLAHGAGGRGSAVPLPTPAPTVS